MSLQAGMKGIDFSGAIIDPKAAYAAGSRFTLRYSAGIGNGSSSSQWKLCKPGEIASIVASGQDFIANSEWYEARCTEGAGAGGAVGTADLSFWKSRGLNKGASIYVSWDTAPNAALFSQVAGYLSAYNQALGGYYFVDMYGGDPVLRDMMRRKIIKYGWRTNATRWNDPSGGQDSFANRADRWKEMALLSPAAIWQTRGYWFGVGADENILLRAACGSHLQAGKPIVEDDMFEAADRVMLRNIHVALAEGRVEDLPNMLIHGDATHLNSLDAINKNIGNLPTNAELGTALTTALQKIGVTLTDKQVSDLSVQLAAVFPPMVVETTSIVRPQ